MDSLVVIQCKNYADLNLTNFNRAVEEFRRGVFYEMASEFYMLIASNLLPPTVEKAALELRRELSGRCIFEVWSGERISEELKLFPEIVEAFFRQDVVEALCQPWGLRRRLLEELSKLQQTDTEVPVPSTAVPPRDREQMRDFLENKEISSWGYKALSRRFKYADAYIYLESFLPTSSDYFGSCLINIKQRNLEGCSFTVGHNEIVNRFIRGATSPVKSRYRRFFLCTKVSGTARCNCRPLGYISMINFLPRYVRRWTRSQGLTPVR
jgi:hypothetical protein